MVVHCGSVLFNPCYSWWNLPFTELDDGTIYREPLSLYLIIKKTWVSCRFFLKQIHWPVVSSTNSIFAGPGPVGPRSQGSRHSTCSAQDDGVQRLCVGDDGRNAWTVMDDWWTVTGWSFLFFPWMVIQDQSIWSSHIIIPIIYMISQ